MNKNKVLIMIVLGFLGLNVNAQQTNNLSTKEPARIYQLNDITSDNLSKIKSVNEKEEVSELRRDAIADVAAAFGASAALSKRMSEIKSEVMGKSSQLDKIFNFSALAIDNGVLPPVLEEGIANYAQENDDEVRIADIIYKIHAPARFVSVYPTWRDYLTFTFAPFDLPEASYLPKNEAEKRIWDEWVKKGWEKGINQANNIYESSWGRLNRDYIGMIKFRVLLAQKVITKPIIAKANLGVTGGGNKLSINDTVFRITDHSALNPNQNEWTNQTPISFPKDMYIDSKK